MASQKKQSRPGWYLASVLLVAVLVLPSLCMDTLLCNHCPMQHKGKSCSNVSTTRCLADERCSSSRGRYGSLHVLSAQGCLAEILCGTHEFQTYRGTRYNVSHTCCCEERCNRAPRPETYLKTLLGLIAHKLDNVNFGNFTRNVIAEVPSDSCVNYTSSRGYTRAVVMNPELRVSEALSVVLLCLWLLPSPLRCDNLRCFYSPLQQREQEAEFELVVTECPPHELCFNGVGRHGNYSALTFRGCMAAEACGRVRGHRVKGTEFVLSYTCCPLPFCNAAPTARSLVPTMAAVLLGLAVVPL